MLKIKMRLLIGLPLKGCRGFVFGTLRYTALISCAGVAYAPIPVLAAPATTSPYPGAPFATTHSAMHNGETSYRKPPKGATKSAASAPGTATIDLACGFYENRRNALHLFLSPGGARWTQAGGGLETPLFSPPGGLRDPSIMYQGSTYWICYTGGRGHGFGVAKSQNLMDWTYVATPNATAGLTGIGSIWAPEWFVDADGAVSVFVAISTTGHKTSFQIYEMHPTNEDFTTWSAPNLVASPGVNAGAIDPFVFREGANYYLLAKIQDSPETEIQLWKATTARGTYTAVRTGDWLGYVASGFVPSRGQQVEAPCLITKPDGTFRIYLDRPAAKGEFYVDSTTAGPIESVSWSAPTGINDGDAVISGAGKVMHVSHMTVLPLRTPDQMRDGLALLLEGLRSPNFEKLTLSPNVDQFDNAITISPTWFYTGRRASERLGHWTIGQDLFADGSVTKFSLSYGDRVSVFNAYSSGLFETKAPRPIATVFSEAIASPPEGTIQAFTDSTTATWGDTIRGGGTNHVLGYYDGTNWTVFGK